MSTGLTVSVDVNGFSSIPTYHQIAFGPHDPVNKTIQIFIKVFSSKAYSLSNKGDYISVEKVMVNGDTYDTYFGQNVSFDAENPAMYLISQAKTYLKAKVKPNSDMTDTERSDSSFTSSRFDYTTGVDA
jgi:hypothetical protein